MIVFCFTQLWDFEEQTLSLTYIFYIRTYIRIHVTSNVVVFETHIYCLKTLQMCCHGTQKARISWTSRSWVGENYKWSRTTMFIIMLLLLLLLLLWWWWWWNNITFSMVLSRGRELVEAPNRCPLGGKSPMQLGPEGRMYIIRRGWEMGKISPMPAKTGPFQLLHS